MSADPLEFVDTKPYKDRIEQAKKSSGLHEAIVSGGGRVGGIGFCRCNGYVGLSAVRWDRHGEKITRPFRTRVGE